MNFVPYNAVATNSIQSSIVEKVKNLTALGRNVCIVLSNPPLVEQNTINE